MRIPTALGIVLCSGLAYTACGSDDDKNPLAADVNNAETSDAGGMTTTRKHLTLIVSSISPGRFLANSTPTVRPMRIGISPPSWMCKTAVVLTAI